MKNVRAGRCDVCGTKVAVGSGVFALAGITCLPCAKELAAEVDPRTNRPVNPTLRAALAVAVSS